VKQIRYNDNANVIKFLFPPEWDPKLVSDVELQITNDAGTVLLADTSITLYTASTISAAAARFAGSVTLTSGAGSPSIGDPMLIAGDVGDEIVFVEGYDTTSRVLTTEETLRHDHEALDAIYGAFGTYTIDTTTVATFLAGLIVTLRWTPTGVGVPITERRQIAKASFDLTGFERDFKDLYARVHDSLKEPHDKFNRMAEFAEHEVTSDLIAKGLDMQRLVDQDKLRPLVMAKLAYNWTLNGDDSRRYENETLGRDYTNKFDRVLQWPLWTDLDQDLVEDESEVSSHNHRFRRSW